MLQASPGFGKEYYYVFLTAFSFPGFRDCVYLKAYFCRSVMVSSIPNAAMIPPAIKAGV